MTALGPGPGSGTTQTYTRQQWATEFLHALGNANPSQAVINWVTGWTAFETASGSGANYNLLNTEQGATGSSSFNSAGVQNYTSFQQGASTNASVLSQNSNYSALLQALQSNNEQALGIGGSPSTGVQQGLNYWCKGNIAQSCYSASSFAKSGVSHLGDLFSGIFSALTPAGNPSTTTTFPSSCPPWDIACSAASFFSSNSVRQVGLVFIALILLLIGLEVVFFGKGKEDKSG